MVLNEDVFSLSQRPKHNSEMACYWVIPSFDSSSHLPCNSCTYAAWMGSLFVNKLISSLSYLLHSFIIFCSVQFALLSSLCFNRMLSLRRIITTLQQFWFLQTTQQTEETLIQRTMQYQLGRRSEMVLVRSYFLWWNECTVVKGGEFYLRFVIWFLAAQEA